MRSHFAPHMLLNSRISIIRCSFSEPIAAANPYDPGWETYFEERVGLQMKENLRGYEKLLKLWYETRKYARQPIPDEFRQAAAEMTGRRPLSLVRRVIKLDPWRLKKSATKKSDRVRNNPQTAFFTLPPEPTLLLPGSSAPLTV